MKIALPEFIALYMRPEHAQKAQAALGLFYQTTDAPQGERLQGIG